MNDHLQKIRDQLWEEPTGRELHIQELEEALSRLEPRVFEILGELPEELRLVIEGYLYSAAELEMYTVIQSFQKGKKLGEEIGRNKYQPFPIVEK